MDDDFSWIETEEKLLKLKEDPGVKVPIEDIKVKVIFIGNKTDNWYNVQHIYSFKYHLESMAGEDSDIRAISPLKIKSYIRSECSTYSSFQLVDISIFHVGLDYNKIKHAGELEEYSKLQNVWKKGEDENNPIIIKPALLIFNEIHTIYCIMKEPNLTAPVSILKKNSAFNGTEVCKTHTKRVRVNLLNNTYCMPNTVALNKGKRFTRHNKPSPPPTSSLQKL